jgi:hypothetical protein
MERHNEMARNLLQQEPGRECRHASNATSHSQIAQSTRSRHKPRGLYEVTPSTGDPFNVTVSGRDKWALDRLREAGRKGCTPMTEPAPRWSAYIHNLRKLGVEIETITEPHEGDFPGHHARYVLRSAVSVIVERGQS